jgi:hypothetical protein
MTAPSDANSGHAKGWMVNKANNWWHTGGLPGTATISLRTHSGFCRAAFANTRCSNTKLDKLVWDMVREVKSWQV